MGKRNKEKKGNTKNRNTPPIVPASQATNIRHITSLHQLDPMGSSWRHYPKSESRKVLVDRLRKKPDAQRTGDDWWQLGEYQILDGLADGNEAMVNAGSQALMAGASMTPPHAGCLLDMGWLLCYKGLDQMALFYFDKAAQEVPHSRDVWALRGWACIGTDSREQAIDSFRKAVSLPGATDGDRSTLQSLESGEALATLRKELVLRKFDDEVVRSQYGDPKDAARSGVVQLKQMLERKPDDADLAYSLAYCYYILGQFDHAEPQLMRLIGEDVDNAEALTLLGLIAMKRGLAAKQQDFYERAVKADRNHVLANVNLASMYQDQGDFHRARPMLVRAIEAAAEGDPHLPIAIDLLGNSYGTIENDYAKEAELHRRAIALDPRRAIFHANLVVSLLSADRAKDAQRALQAAKDKRLPLPNQSLLENLIKLYQERSLHPYEYMRMIDALSAALGWAALKPLARRAWDQRQRILPAEQIEFLGALGLMASRVGDQDLALEIWRYGMVQPGGAAFGANVAAELSMMNRNSEALAAAEVMSMETPRSWTILGNIRQKAGFHKLALEAYLVALKKDERFLLPLSNAVASAKDGFLAEELNPFIERLETEWQSLPSALALLGQALVLQGRLTAAANSFERALWSASSIRTPEDLWKDGRLDDDLSLPGEPSIEQHYAGACCFLELGRLDKVLALTAQIRDWPRWMNGDWLILESEVFLAAGDFDRAAAIISSMTDQPPPRLVSAKIAIAQGSEQLADQLIANGLADEQAHAFKHPFGRLDALFRVLASQRALSKGEPEEAESLAREAVRRDPTCAAARMALVDSLSGRISEPELQQLLRDGLRRSPGHVGLVAALVELLVASGQTEEATHVLEENRSLMLERGDQIATHKLGELLAVDRLSRLAVTTSATLPSTDNWPWLGSLSSPLQEWLRGAKLSLERSDELAAAYGLYVSKAAEYILIERVMLPFRDACPDAPSLLSEKHRDVGRFMAGGIAPSVGGIARLFDAANKSYRSSEDELTTRFRDMISSGCFGDAKTLRSDDFVNELLELGMARNSTAHLGEGTLADLQKATRCVIAGDTPGRLLTVLNIVTPN